jgi:hypothetical protein
VIFTTTSSPAFAFVVTNAYVPDMATFDGIPVIEMVATADGAPKRCYVPKSGNFLRRKRQTFGRHI